MDLTLNEILKTILLGIVEGVTEWLPISSTGHMILVDEVIRLNVSDKFLDMFLVVIQLGAILAVVTMNFVRLNPWGRGKSPEEKQQAFSLWGKVLVASVPAGVIGLALNRYMKDHFMNAPVVAAMLILYGVLFIWVENYNRHRRLREIVNPRFMTLSFWLKNYNRHRRPRITELDALDYPTALLIGFFQVLALVPGTSRSGATILGGILLGASRLVATEFTFFLAIPVMFGASFLKMVKFGWHYSASELVILAVGMITAYIVSVASIKFLLRYIKRNDFKAFGWYRIALGLIVIICLVMR